MIASPQLTDVAAITGSVEGQRRVAPIDGAAEGPDACIIMLRDESIVSRESSVGSDACGVTSDPTHSCPRVSFILRRLFRAVRCIFQQPVQLPFKNNRQPSIKNKPLCQLLPS
jgi:hypothetical protein